MHERFFYEPNVYSPPLEDGTGACPVAPADGTGACLVAPADGTGACPACPVKSAFSLI